MLEPAEDNQGHNIHIKMQKIRVVCDLLAIMVQLLSMQLVEFMSML